MSELQESILRGKVMTLLYRNYDSSKVYKRGIERFMKCIKSGNTNLGDVE